MNCRKGYPEDVLHPWRLVCRRGRACGGTSLNHPPQSRTNKRSTLCLDPSTPKRLHGCDSNPTSQSVRRWFVDCGLFSSYSWGVFNSNRASMLFRTAKLRMCADFAIATSVVPLTFRLSASAISRNSSTESSCLSGCTSAKS